MGYCGGDTTAATYQSVCAGDGHTEAIRVEIDPDVLSYDAVLELFWAKHNPCSSSKPQYMSAIFVADEEQGAAARASLDAEQKSRPQKIATKILPFDPELWSDAEDYHQKYFSKNRY